MKSIIIMLALFLAPTFSFGQYFQGLYDVDTSQDWGVDMFLQHNGSYFIFGSTGLTTPYAVAYFNMQVSHDGSNVINKNLLTVYPFNIYMGDPGATKHMPGGYIAPVNIENYYLTDSWAGFIKYNAAGDVVFLKTYTDTPLYYAGMLTCAVMPDGGYIGGGGVRLN